MDLPAKAQLADLLLDGGLAALIHTERAKSPPTSYERIAKEIWSRSSEQVSVSGVSVRNWELRLTATEVAA